MCGYDDLDFQTSDTLDRGRCFVGVGKGCFVGVGKGCLGFLEVERGKNRKMMLIIRWVLLLGLVAGMLGCQPRVQFSIPEDQPCTPPPDLKKYLRDNPAISACLVVLWKGQPQGVNAGYPISLKANGSFVFRREKVNSTNAGFFELPKKARGQSLLFRVYVLRPSATPTTLEEHAAVCNIMGAPDYNCFASDSYQCWSSIQFTPQTAQKSYPVLAIPGGSCRVCQPEICDGKDNNCNNQIDEYNEILNQSCP